MSRVLTTLGMMVVCGVVWAAPKASDVLFVGRLEAKGLSQDEASVIEGSVCTAASQDGRFSVRCLDTSRDVANLRALQAGLGHDEDAQFKDDCGKKGCMDSLSKASDAKWVLGGSVSKVAEKQYLLTLRVVDPHSNTQINRIEEKVAGGLDSVVDRVPTAVRRVLTPPRAAK